MDFGWYNVIIVFKIFNSMCVYMNLKNFYSCGLPRDIDKLLFCVVVLSNHRMTNFNRTIPSVMEADLSENAKRFL